MTHTPEQPPVGVSPLLDVVPAEAPGPAGRLRRAALAGVAGAAALVVAGTAWAAASYLSGGGAQPEEVLPASVLAVAKIDLDPAAGQKLAVYRLAQRFPSTRDDVRDEDDLRDQLLRSLLDGNPDVDYARDVEPWIGDRAAVAAVPVPGAEPQVLAALAVTDRAAAEEALQRLTAAASDVAWTFSDRAEYVLVGQTRAAVDAAAAAAEVLADVDAYRDAVDALDGDQIVTAWADLDRVWEAMPEQARAAVAQEQFTLTGRVVVGVRAESDAVEVVGRTFGMSTGTPAVVGERAGVDLVQALPEGTVGAVGVTDLGPGLAQLWAELGGQAPPADPGLRLPDDLVALFGEQTAAAVFEDSGVAARSRTDDPERAAEVVGDLSEVVPLGLLGLFGGFGMALSPDEAYGEVYEGEVLEGMPPPGPGELGFETGPGFESELPPGSDGESMPDWYVEGDGLLVPPDPGAEPGVVHGSRAAPAGLVPPQAVRVLEDGLVVGSSPEAIDRMASDDGGLGRSEVFRAAVPDADDAGFVLFVDLRRALSMAGAEMTADLEPLAAVGVSSRGGPDASFRVRLTLR